MKFNVIFSGDASKPKAWSKYAVDSSAHEKLMKKEGAADEVKEDSTAKVKSKKTKKKEKKEKENALIAEALSKVRKASLQIELIKIYC